MRLSPEFTLHVCVHSHTAVRDPRSYTYIPLVAQTDTVTACTSLSRASLGIERKGLKKGMPLLSRPISSLACPRYFTTSTKCVTDDLTRRVPSVLSRAGVPSSSCSVPSRYRSSVSHLIFGPCHALLLRTNARAKLNISDAWRQPDLHRRAQVATYPVGKSVLSYRAILRPRDAERRTFMYWMKAKTVTTQQHCAAFQKVRILFTIGLSLIRHQCILG
jgi:hypothetical protein